MLSVLDSGRATAAPARAPHDRSAAVRTRPDSLPPSVLGSRLCIRRIRWNRPSANRSVIRSTYSPQRVPLPLTTCDFRPLRFSCSAERPDDAEPDERGVGVPPDALRPLGVLDAPLGVRPAPRGAAELVGVVVPRPAADHVGIFLGVGQDDRAERRLVGGERLVGVGDVVIEAPLGDVAVHVVQAPGIGLLLADLLGLLGVVDVPGVLAELLGVVAPGVGGLGAGAAGVFPLGLGGQAIDLAGLLGEPAAVFHRGVVGDADDRLAVAAEAEGLVGVGRGRAGDGVGLLLGLGLPGEVDLLPGLLLQVEREGEQVVFLPGDLALAHPERGDLDGVLRALVLAALLLARRAAHGEGAAGDRQHLELHVGPRDRLDIRRHRGRLGGGLLGRRGPCRRARPDARIQRAARPIACGKRITFGMLQGDLEIWTERPDVARSATRGVIMGATFAAWLLISSVPCCGAGEDPGRGGPLVRFEFEETHMASPFHLVLYSNDATAARRASRAAFDRIEALNKVLSDYDPESELSRLSQSAGRGPVKVERRPVRRARAIEADLRAVGGDVRRHDRPGGPALAAGASRPQAPRSPADRRGPEARRLRQDGARPGRADREPDGARHEAGRRRHRQGLRGPGGARCPRSRWEFAAPWWAARATSSSATRPRMPRAGRSRSRRSIPRQSYRPPTLLLKNAAVSTAGDAERFVVIDGHRYSHIVNPKTGMGHEDRAAVTVVAPDGGTADALETTAYLLGPERGLKLVDETPGAAALSSASRPRGSRPSNRRGSARCRRSRARETYGGRGRQPALIVTAGSGMSRTRSCGRRATSRGR